MEVTASKKHAKRTKLLQNSTRRGRGRRSTDENGPPPTPLLIYRTRAIDINFLRCFLGSFIEYNINCPDQRAVVRAYNLLHDAVTFLGSRMTFLTHIILQQ